MLYWQILKRDVTEEEQAKKKKKLFMKQRASWLNTKTVVSKTTKKKIFWEAGNFALQLRGWTGQGKGKVTVYGSS